jgi:hypothetical protein
MAPVEEVHPAEVEQPNECSEGGDEANDDVPMKWVALKGKDKNNGDEAGSCHDEKYWDESLSAIADRAIE